METEEIKQLIAYAKAQDSENAEKYYITLSKLVNKATGINSNSRDITTISKLNSLILIENIIGNVIKEGSQQQLYYKDIYKECKKRIEEFKQIAYLQEIA